MGHYFKRKKNNKAKKLEKNYFDVKEELFNPLLSIDDRIKACITLKDLMNVKDDENNIPLNLSEECLKPTWVANFLLTRGNKGGKHIAVLIDKNGDKYCIVGCSSNEKTDGKRNLPLDNLEIGKDGFSNIVLDLKTTRSKGSKIVDKYFDKRKNENRPLRSLTEKEKELIVDILNIYSNNKEKYAKWIDDYKKNSS